MNVQGNPELPIVVKKKLGASSEKGIQITVKKKESATTNSTTNEDELE